MGNGLNYPTYNILDKDTKPNSAFSGPFVNPIFGHFENNRKQQPDTTVISQLKQSFSKFSQNECMGYRVPLYNEKTEFSPDYKYLKYGEVWKMAETMSKALEKKNLIEEVEFKEEKGKHNIILKRKLSTSFLSYENQKQDSL